MNRTEAREIAFKILFSNQFLDNGFDIEIFTELLDGNKCSQKDIDFVKSLVLGVKQNKDVLEEVIRQNLSEYKYERLFSADKVALILCVYEIKFTDTPKKVAINEALNLVKKYSTEKSAGFVNSVLDKICQGLEKNE